MASPRISDDEVKEAEKRLQENIKNQEKILESQEVELRDVQEALAKLLTEAQQLQSEIQEVRGRQGKIIEAVVSMDDLLRIWNAQLNGNGDIKEERRKKIIGDLENITKEFAALLPQTGQILTEMSQLQGEAINLYDNKTNLLREIEIEKDSSEEEVSTQIIEARTTVCSLQHQPNRISPIDTETWIQNSPFNSQILQVRKFISELDSMFVYNGRAKAYQIRCALNFSIEEAKNRENGQADTAPFKDFSEFADFRPYPGMLSLAGALSIHRFPDLDMLLNIKSVNSQSVLSKKS